MSVDSLPFKLLDCAEVRAAWPWWGFEELGHVARIDYSTNLHTGFREWELYTHDFTTPVSIYRPGAPGASETGALVSLERAVDPIVLGLVARVDVAGPAGRNMVFVRPDFALDETEATPVEFLRELGEAILTWDPEGNQLLAMGTDGYPRFVMREGGLTLSDECMILG